MRSYLILISLLLGSLFARAHAAPAETLLAGTWHIDLAHSTELSPWKDYTLTISVDGDAIKIHRWLAWGRREFSDEMIVRTDRAEKIPVEMWPDNRHLGAYIGGDRTKTVRAEWLDDKKVLRIFSDLVLDTQQGARAVNILSNYKVSSSGTMLTVTELRSTRNRPTVYVFTRTKK
ncbi:hypothetical protein [Oleiharenicola lentus]|uniref:hypothetical protein n=1 Tax=Oleiharenicola lentus TaxID=2508720 RepID=UPI003F66F65F